MGEGFKGPLAFEECWRVVRDWKELNGFDLWPADEPEKVRKFLEFCCSTGLLTLLIDSQGRLEGFLTFYRSHQYAGLDWARPIMVGEYVVCDVFWVRPDLKKTDAADRLIRLAIRESKEKILGAEKIVFFRAWNNFKPVIYDFPRFYRRYSWQRADRQQHSNSK